MSGFASPGALIDRAVAETGLCDFGADTFRDGLDRLCIAAREEARFTESGRAAFEAMLVSYLVQRLHIEDWYARHPEIDDEQINAPLIGLGLPRTGSTALHCMLGEDPAVRVIRTWEANEPCPPPEFATYWSDQRITKAQAAMERRNQLFPRAKAMLPSTATSPTECQTFMAMEFKSQIFQAFAHIPSYIGWFNHQADLTTSYAYVKRILKLLQWRCGPRKWRLKNPTNAIFIDAVGQIFPDARFWMTHRDVANVIPSVADLYFEYSKAFSDQVDKAWLGEITSAFCELGMRRMIAFRDAGQDHRFFDIHFTAFQRDPFPQLQALYDWLGEELTDQSIARMKAWRLANAREKHGGHIYDPAEFGLSPDGLRTRFEFYATRFGVE